MERKNDGLENIISAEGIFSNSDHHGNLDAFEKGLDYSQKNNLLYLHAGDIVNDYNLISKANELGFMLPQDHFVSYSQEQLQKGNVSSKDIQTFNLVSMYSSSPQSLENLLSQVPSEEREEVQKSIEELISYSDSKEFKSNIQSFLNNFQEEKGDLVNSDFMKIRALYEVFMDEEAKSVANSLNKYSDVKMAFVLGNHENSYFVDNVKKYLENKDQIINLNQTSHVKVRDSSGEEITVAGMTNCLAPMPYVSQLFNQEEFEELYSHMNLDENQYKSLLSSSSNNEDLKNLEQFYSQDKEYKRIKSHLEDKLDVLVSHGQIGKPMKKNGEVYDVPYLASAAALSSEAQLTIEGHLHSEYEGKNSLGNKLVRSTGGRGAVLKKVDGEVIIEDWYEVDKNFNGNHKNSIPYSNEYLALRIEDLLKKYSLNVEDEETSPLSSNSFSKAA